jgi:ribonuclease Z
MVARDANAKQLLLGHYSSRYTNETILLDEAKKVFPNSILSNEGMIVSIK